MEFIEKMLGQLSQMQLTDYLDILLVALLIYLILPLLKAPSTMRIARAIAAVLLLASLTEILQLYTLSFILNQFLGIGLIALVILFQPELRRMLDRLGSVKFRSFLGKPAITLNLINFRFHSCNVCSTLCNFCKITCLHAKCSNPLIH